MKSVFLTISVSYCSEKEYEKNTMAKSSSSNGEFRKPPKSRNSSCYEETAVHQKQQTRSSKRPATVVTTKQQPASAVMVTEPGLLNQTSYTNATVALAHVKKVCERKERYIERERVRERENER